MLGAAQEALAQRLQALAQEQPDLSEAVEVYAALLPILNEADLCVEPLAIVPGEARATVENGVPLLQAADLAFDEEAARRLLIRLTEALQKVPERNEAQPGRAASARQIRRTLEVGGLEPKAMFTQVRADQRAEFSAVAASWQLDPGLLWTLTKYALTPALRAWARQLGPLVAPAAWHQSTCFICGAEALLGELQGSQAEKHLRCGQCGADWTCRRMRCVYCGNEDHRTFGHFYYEAGCSGKRVEVCDQCKHYLKVLTAFEPTPPERLAVEDLATLPLEYIAQKQGYVRGGRPNGLALASVPAPAPSPADKPATA